VYQISTTRGTFVDFKDRYLLHIVKSLLLISSFLVISCLCVFMPWYYLFALLLFIIIVVILFARFQYVVYLLFFLVPVSSRTVGVAVHSSWNFIVADRYIDQISISFPFIIVSFLGLILAKWAKTRTFFLNPLKFPLYILFIYAILTLLWAPNFGHSLFQLIILAFNLALCALTFNAISDERSHRKIMWCWLIAGLFQSGIEISLYFIEANTFLFFNYELFEDLFLNLNVLSGGVTGTGYIKRGNVLTNPNESALIFNLYIPVAVGLLLAEKDGFKKGVLIATIIILIASNLLTMSRAGLGSLLMMVFFLFVTQRKLRKHFFALSIVFIAIVIIIPQIELRILTSAFLRHDIPSRWEKSLQDTKEYAGIPGLKDRVKWWKGSYDKLRSVSFLGVGVGNVKYYLKIPHPHSIYFSFLFDFGFIGVGALLAIIIILGRRFFAIFKHQYSYFQTMCISFFAGFIAIGLHGLVDFEYNTPFIWLYLGMSVATLNLAQTELWANK